MAKITPELIALAYRLGRMVYLDEISREDAEQQLEASGMNKTSASFSIGNLRQMLNGAAYHRAMSIGQTRFFIAAIHEDDGLDGLKKAVAALAEHLPYIREANGNGMPGLSALLKEFEKLATLPVSTGDAIDDLDQIPPGIKQPKKVAKQVSIFVRNSQVRAAVRNRASGRCEFCKKPGFLLPDGTRYIETHHVIHMARQGPDTTKNVIALCADHHREAHFGDESRNLEKEFLRILETIA